MALNIPSGDACASFASGDVPSVSDEPNHLERTVYLCNLYLVPLISSPCSPSLSVRSVASIPFGPSLDPTDSASAFVFLLFSLDLVASLSLHSFLCHLSLI